MPIQTDLSVSPYFDDFDPEKNYYKILFQPGVAVQARELNQLQTILQNQIERFGDNVLRKGTVIEGCNVIYHSRLPYVKVRDVESDGAPVNVGSYKTLYAKNSANLQAIILDTTPGLETSSPDLNTLYVKYQNSGDNYETTAFAADELLTIFDPKNPIFEINIDNGSSGFANTDAVVITSAIAIQNSTGGTSFGSFAIEVNDYIRNAGVATAQIVEVDTTSMSDAVVLRIKPLAENLKAANSMLWTFYTNDAVELYKFSSPTTKSSANKLIKMFGAGAKGSLITDSLGKVTSISVANRGQGYDIEPYISVASTSAILTDIGQFAATAQRFLTTVSVAPSSFDPIGYGFGMTVTDGIVYQKGYFSRVPEQLKVVEKYSNTGFDKSVGFYTVETVVDSDIDESLLDNATGTPNYTAPGANRLQLIPTLSVLTRAEAEANNEFFSIVDFALGSPYKQSRQTVYSTIGDVIAQRTSEESGDYVLDNFYLNTKDSTTAAKRSSVFNIYVDPGVAYIKGYKVKTDTNYIEEVSKGTNTFTKSNAVMSMEYGSYFRVNELGGSFNFASGDIIELYDLPKSYLSANAGFDVTTATSSVKIGQARIRALTYEYGAAPVGSPNAAYKMYVFDLQFEPGKSAGDVRSIYYPGQSTKAIADVILDNGLAVLYDAKNSSMLFKVADATKSVSGINYIYRNSTLVTSVGSSGTFTIANSAGETFPYTSTGSYLSDIEESTINVIPLNDIEAAANIGGSMVTSTSSPTVTGTATTFASSLSEGEYVKIANATHSFVSQIARIGNNTSMTLTANGLVAITGANAVIYYPKNVSIPLTRNATKRASITTTAPIGRLQIELGALKSTTSANVVVEYNTRRNFTVVPKTTTRGAHARIRIANNAAGAAGPWALGVADVFRLRNVYAANGAVQTFSVNTTSGVTDSTNFITIANNPYANGDQLTYDRPTSNTANIGLTNAASYYVIFANSSGVKLSTTYGGSEVDVFGNVSITETHSLAGRAVYFTPNTYGVTDVTRDYYIDTNQTADYYDTSYLYRKPNLGAVSTNDVLLVKFDAFQSTTDGVKAITSYDLDDTKTYTQLLASTKVNTLEIPELYDNATGKYYDLRDYLDARPVSTNTIPLITDTTAYSNTLIVDPREPVDGVFANANFNASTGVNSTTDFITITSNPFIAGDPVVYNVAAGNTAVSPLVNNATYYVLSANTTGVILKATPDSTTKIELTAGSNETGHTLTKTMLRFSQTAKYFPLPGTSGEIDLEFYQGRIDRVVLTTDGRFRTIKGTPGVYDAAPPTPVDSMTINVLVVPPYPTLPFALSEDIAKIVDTKVANEKPSDRLSIYRVRNQLTADDVAKIQIKPYRMSDIAALERRISTLEKYVSVTLSESVARSRYIPSSSDPSIDRFKFGFFVDSFTTTGFAEITHPEYAATIIADRLVPKTETTNLELTFDTDSDGVISDNIASFEDQEYVLISQLLATTDNTPSTGTTTTGSTATTTTTPTTTTPTTTPTTTTPSTPTTTTPAAPIVTQSITTATGYYRTNQRRMDFSAYEDWTYTFSTIAGPARLYVNTLDNKTNISVYQSTVPNDTSGTPIITSRSGVFMTAAEKAPGGEAYNVVALTGHASEYGVNHGNGWLEDFFKLNWYHNPENGTYYTIRVYKGGGAGADAPNGFYAFQLYYPIDTVTTIARDTTVSGSFDYNGRVQSVTPPTFTFTQYLFGGAASSPYVADAQRFRISVSGLRPLTRHFFYFDGEDQTAKCVRVVAGTSIPSWTGSADLLISDASGILEFDFFFDGGIDEAAGSNFTLQNQLAALAVGIKSFNVTNADGASAATGSIELKYYATPEYNIYVPTINVPVATQDNGATTTQAAVATETQPWTAPSTTGASGGGGILGAGFMIGDLSRVNLA